MNQPFDEKKVLEESFRTLIEQRSNGEVNKYKIIDIDGSEISIDILLEKYFFSKGYYTSCSVVLQKSYNNSIEESSIDDRQTEANEEETEKLKESESYRDKINTSTDTTAIESNYSPYRYTSEQIEEFFASDHGQVGEHTLEDSSADL